MAITVSGTPVYEQTKSYQEVNNALENKNALTPNGYASPIVDALYQGGQGLGAPLTGLSGEVRKSLNNVGLGLNDALSVGVGGSIENIGTSTGKGLNNLAIGAIPAFAILIGVVVVFHLAKRI